MLKAINEDQLGPTFIREIFSDSAPTLWDTMHRQGVWRKQNAARDLHWAPLWKRPTMYISVDNERMRLEIAQLKGLINRGTLQTVCGNLLLDRAQSAKRREDSIEQKSAKGRSKKLRVLSRRTIFDTAFNNQLFLNVFLAERYRMKIAYLAAACAVILLLLTLMTNPGDQQVEHRLLQAWQTIGNNV